MRMAVKNFFRFLKMNMRCNLLSAVEYRKSFLIQSIFMFVNNGFFLLFWLVVFDVNGGEVKGITMQDILYLWAFSAIAYGIANFVFGGSKNLGKYILEGTFDTFLIQPKNVIMNVATSASDFSACGDLLYGFIVGWFAVEGDIGKYLIVVLISIFVSIFFVCTNTLVKLLTVWIGDTENIAHVYFYTLMVTFTLYPEPIYSGFIKALLYTVIPAAYVVFVPLHFMNDFRMIHLWIILGAASFYIALTVFVTKAALKRYESGNAMVMRG